ncbi:hypothetical protein F5X98DRAFT_371990 [Xylaria grammica]|nr:hypothetical protein F5X98DRAFT_371990 [Xylaria grammica]
MILYQKEHIAFYLPVLAFCSSHLDCHSVNSDEVLDIFNNEDGTLARVWLVDTPIWNVADGSSVAKLKSPGKERATVLKFAPDDRPL